MPELLSRSKQETEEFKSRLDAGFGPEGGKNWFDDDHVSDDVLAAELEHQKTAALEKMYAAPAYGEKPAGYSMYEEMLNEEPALPEDSAAFMTPDLKALEDGVNRSDYDDFSKEAEPVMDDGVVERGFGTTPNILSPELTVGTQANHSAETVAVPERRAPRHAKELHVEDEQPEAAAQPEAQESLDTAALNELLTAASDALAQRKAELAAGTSTPESDQLIRQQFQDVINKYWQSGLDLKSLELVGNFFREGYEVQSLAPPPSAEKSEVTQPEAVVSPLASAEERPEPAPLTTDSRPITQSIDITPRVSVENASQADAADAIGLQDEIDISDEIENVALTDETAPITTESVLTAQAAEKPARTSRLKEAVAGIKEKAGEKLASLRSAESLHARGALYGEFNGRKPVAVVIGGKREEGWSVANKMYNPLDRDAHTYDLLSPDGRILNGVSELQLREWRDAAEASVTVPEVPVTVPEVATSVTTPQPEDAPQDIDDGAEENDDAGQDNANDGPRHRADKSSSILKYTAEQTIENANELLNKSEWWRANGDKVKDAFRPSFWAAKWHTMAVKEIEGWQGEGMNDQQKREFRRKRETLGVAAMAAGFVAMGVMIIQGHDVSALHTGLGGFTPPKPPSPDAMPDMSAVAPQHATEHVTTILGNEPDPSLLSAPHGEAIANAFDAKDFMIPEGGSISGLMAHLNFPPEQYKTVQFDLLKLSPSEFFMMPDGNVGIVDPNKELSQPVQDFFNALERSNG